MTVRTIVHCPGCGATWDLDSDPVACDCDYSDPDKVIIPWTWTTEEAA